MARQLVRYVWSVVPTTIEDRYVFTITATFETRVPAPVVVINPQQIDTSLLVADEQVIIYIFTI